jgi:D-sedoheptulose 7-phosphate isomerase
MCALGDKDIQHLGQAAETAARGLARGGEVIFFGNGGSAAQAEHLAAELVGRFLHSREPLNARALSCNLALLTAIGNDFSFDEIYRRQLLVACKPHDLIVALSTSGTSPNIETALKFLSSRGQKVLGLAGKNTNVFERYCTWTISVKSNSTPRIQEVHLFLGHVLCSEIESRYASQLSKK